MDSEVESVCCREVENVDMKRDSFNSESQEALQCITEHPGFRTVCLNSMSWKRPTTSMSSSMGRCITRLMSKFL
ncbi:hypothetical protein DPMN_019231 [Dreissena polymorpha]|uniref:Uncharacterized protein n=1 Tax=Dreissena polymorpha TaxID=45954 RepID=A0A9D4NI06_DREPO|nr:hypothetical protein DPMN_075422 [Dreissena polymorpha]KAH3895060.1 hypothetical protein DPMN_019220 [Dreissena polymorpha]KAH3895071.1 hypothetical protein DPMN_019231 [Dreissena polymorpha]